MVDLAGGQLVCRRRRSRCRGEQPPSFAFALLLDQALKRVCARSCLAEASHITGVPAQFLSAWVDASREQQDDVAKVLELKRRSRP